jgi:hypothetical protein
MAEEPWYFAIKDQTIVATSKRDVQHAIAIAQHVLSG